MDRHKITYTEKALANGRMVATITVWNGTLSPQFAKIVESNSREYIDKVRREWMEDPYELDNRVK